MDNVAMWVGYAVMAAGAIAGVAFVVGALCTYAWRKLLEDAPSMVYLQRAVAEYRKTNPPSRWSQWAREDVAEHQSKA